MKNLQWISTIKTTFAAFLDGKPKRLKRRKSETSVSLSCEHLESRQLLAVVGFDAGLGQLTFTADAGEVDIVTISESSPDTLQILVENGDAISLQGDAAANADFQLSTTNVANDTLQIDTRSALINDFFVALADLDDILTISSFSSAFALTVDGGEGADNLNATANSTGVTLVGGTGNDTLTGGAGDDVLIGGGGTDIIDGGTGIDTNSFEGIGLGVTATVAADGSGTAEYGAVNETFTGIENLTGSANDDVLIATGVAANTLIGGDGNDILAGGGGTDIIDGGAGIDANSFQGIGFGVTAVLAADGTGTADYGPVSETFTGIESLIGSENDDVFTVTGTIGRVLSGEGGNDLLIGGGGDDTLNGNDGNDILRGRAGNDLIFGGQGADTLNGGGGNDSLQGEEGDDLLIGVGGTDVIDGGAGIDTNSFQGIGVGVTATVAADGTGTASYGLVNESFTGIENLFGSNNDDVLSATGLANNTIRGFDGNDIVNGGDGDDVLLGDSGNDILRGAAGDDVALGGLGDDSLNGGGGDDFLRGDDGDDFFVGIGGTDVIQGGAGVDTNSFQGIGLGVTATINDDGSGTARYGLVNESFSGIEALIGSDNNDVLLVNGARATLLNGLGGDDILIGGSGADTLVGGVGNDVINARAGNDLVIGGNGSDTVSGGTGDDRLVGNDGDDNLIGDAGLDLIFGGTGNDSLFGGDDEDELRGQDGDDLLVGGPAFDLLFGGSGVDELIQ